MKNIRHNKIRNTAIAIVTLAGLAVATTACSSNSSTDSATKDLDATIETVADQSESADKIGTPAVSSISAKVESPAASSTRTPSTTTPSTTTPSTATPSTDTPASPEDEPVVESAETEADTTVDVEGTEETEADPGTEGPTIVSPTIPGIVLSPTISFVTFAQDGVNINTSILVEEAGLGRNDIVSVEFTYTRFGTERTVAATKASSTTTSSLWLVESLMLRVGSTVSIRAVDSRGNSDDITKTVVLSAALG